MSGRCLRVGFRQALPGFEMDIHFEAPSGATVLFGPSGAGKSRTLHAIAGLLLPDAGEIAFGDEVWFRRGLPGLPDVQVPPRRRRVGVVFQHYALFPHLSVLENVGFARWPGRDRRERARAWLARLRLEHLAERSPAQLSGGQQQRVALARALVSEPALLLLDEPFSAIDAAARDRIQEDLALVRREVGLSLVFVTHRIEDLKRLGDRLVVLDEGRVVREGPIDASFAAAHSLGAGPAIPNLFRVRVREASAAGLRLDWGGLVLTAPPAPLDEGASVEVYVRPEAVKLIYPDRPLGPDVCDNVLDALVLDVRQVPGGRVAVLRVANGGDLHARFPGDHYARVDLAPGAGVQIALWRPGVVVL